jgi:hypothetical protein
MGTVLLLGGLLGSALGGDAFNYLKAQGQVDLLVKLCYVVFLGTVGGLMLWESVRATWLASRGVVRPRRRHGWVHSLPFKSRFRVSGLYISSCRPSAWGCSWGSCPRSWAWAAASS